MYLRAKKYSEFITSYTISHDKCEVYDFSTQSSFFQLYCVAVRKPSDSTYDRRRVCTVSLTSSLAGSRPRKASLMVRTCDNPTGLGPDYTGGAGVLNFSCLITPAAAAAECRCALSWSEITYFCAIHSSPHRTNILLQIYKFYSRLTTKKKKSQLPPLQQCNSKGPPSLRNICKH